VEIKKTKNRDNKFKKGDTITPFSIKLSPFVNFLSPFLVI